MWNEEHWPLVLQLYKRKPEGMKSMYARQTVRLALELHVRPEEIYERLFDVRNPRRPFLRHLRHIMDIQPRRLQRLCRALRQMDGMGKPSVFFEDVPLNETWEKDWRPVNAKTAQLTGRPLFTPVMLTIILDLYFRLVPATMQAETPEVRETAQLMDISAEDVADVLTVFQYCDPELPHDSSLFDPLLPACTEVWQRYAAGSAAKLSNRALQLRAYWEER